MSGHSTPNRRGGMRRDDDSSDAGDMCIPGIGENKPKPRVLGTAFFGYVPDAFSMKTPDLPSGKPSSKSRVSEDQAAEVLRSVPADTPETESVVEEPLTQTTVPATEAVPLEDTV